MLTGSVDNFRSRHRIVYVAVWTLLIASLGVRLIEAVVWQLDADSFNRFNTTDFLINFRGGFVRRGLMGELLLRLTEAFPGIETGSLELGLTVFSIIVLGLVWWWFVAKFRRRKYSLWLLFSPFLIGSVANCIRKDFLLYLILIGVLTLLQGENRKPLRATVATLLTLIALMLHEAYIFWGYVPFALILLQAFRQRSSEYGRRWLYFSFCLLPLLLFIVLSIYKGDRLTALAIINSWNAALPDNPLEVVANHSVGAIGWSVEETMLMHWRFNTDYDGFGMLFVPLTIIGAFYLLSNFLPAFSPMKSDKEAADTRLGIGVCYATLIITLIPMLTVLSCDQIRVFQSAGVAAMALFLTFPAEKVTALFPRWWVKAICRCGDRLRRAVVPSRGVLILLLLFLGIGTDQFSLDACFTQSVVGSIWRAALYYFYPTGHIFPEEWVPFSLQPF